MLIWFFILYFSVRIFQQWKGIRESLSFIQRKRVRGNRKNRVTILIPLFCEDKILEASLQFWKKSNYSPIFITTKKEQKFHCNSEKILKKYGFQFITAPNLVGAKATQLNYAISKISDTDYFAIFDIDSRPDLEVFEFVEQSSLFKIAQMGTLFTQDFSNLSLFGKGGAIFQTRRVLSFEIPKWINQEFNYLVGHGLFVHKSVFDEVQFSEESLTEDLIFGYKTYFLGYRVTPLPFFDRAVVPSSILTAIQQQARWFSGDFLFGKEFPFSKEIFFRYLHILDWLLGVWIVFAILIFGDSLQQIATLILVALFFYLHKIVIEFLEYYHSSFFRCHFDRVKRREILVKKIYKITLYLGIFLKTSTNSLAPLYGLFRIFLDKLHIKKWEFQKTEK